MTIPEDQQPLHDSLAGEIRDGNRDVIVTEAVHARADTHDEILERIHKSQEKAKKQQAKDMQEIREEFHKWMSTVEQNMQPMPDQLQMMVELSK